MKPITKTLIFGGLFLAGIIALQYFGIGGKYLIWVAILACLGMHFFMGHGGEGHGQHAEHTVTQETKQEKQEEKAQAADATHHKKHGSGGCCH